MMLTTTSKILFLTALVAQLVVSVVSSHGAAKGVTYDGKSLFINGKRMLLFSGSIHYPRCPPEMWPDIFKKAKQGGLNVIQTYVFWNIHEPIQGQLNFEGNYDLVKFIKMAGEHGLYVTLRVGPFIEAEWNYGGLPIWLKEIPQIIFRSDNQPFMQQMEKFTRMIIKKMMDEKLFASQGGPIILSQIENEYNSVQQAYKEHGTTYVHWAGNMAVGLNTGVPWIMCKQTDAPGAVINTCNGRNCGDTFGGPNSPDKPTLWTENWTAQYRAFGDPPSQRTAEDIAFSIARFFSKNGTLANYYMYYGGTNYGRTTASFITTQYYDEAPLDEYGLQREPKWGHLRNLHNALKLSQKALLWGSPSVQVLGDYMEARVYEGKGHACAAFLSNNNTLTAETVKFRGAKYYLPPRSISILSDCKTVVYNTRMIVSQHNERRYKDSDKANKLQWTMFKEKIPTPDNSPLKFVEPMEHFSTTKDETDYLWFTTSLKLEPSDFQPTVHPVLEVTSLGHVLHAFVNGEYVGSGHGNLARKNFDFKNPVSLKPGINHISILGATVGFPDSGSYLEHRVAGVRAITVLGLKTSPLELTRKGWSHKISIDGEKLNIFTEQGSQKVKWTKAEKKQALAWYKANFDAPEGKDPVAISMETMSKGMVWVNGKSIGRYWSSYLSPLGNPSQSIYHIPRAFLKPKENLIVVLEEMGGKVEGIKIQTVNRDTICSMVREDYPPTVKSGKRRSVSSTANNPKPTANLVCPENKIITHVEFASYGDPLGECGNLFAGNCTAPNSQKVVEQYCLGKTKCAVPLEKNIFDKDGKLCPHILKSLAVQAHCGHQT
ncbi:hypothetical protein PIB30_047173 [Stylosanthes scabra]|uniref:Beta-galactosidase n=1 Tax=Stylosanthes scabra TaxID=79078 RepID=A0ABU6YFF4_9FABA|nr:hypothetical protein [Stylosanthes scabra]